MDEARRQTQAMMERSPLFRRAEEMASGKSEDEIRQVAQNLCRQLGIDYDYAYSQFQVMCGISHRH